MCWEVRGLRNGLPVDASPGCLFTSFPPTLLIMSFKLHMDALKARLKTDDYACDPATREALMMLALLRCARLATITMHWQRRGATAAHSGRLRSRPCVAQRDAVTMSRR